MENTIEEQKLIERLKGMGYYYLVIRDNMKNFEKQKEEQKQEIMDIMSKLNIDKFDDGIIQLSITTVDKSYLDNELTIKYLKEHGLEKYIKTKEYFEPDDLIIASNNGELNLEDIAKFKIEKKETRLNAKDL